MPRLHRRPMLLLIHEIASGELAEGDRLPKEVDLASRFDVSRGVVRECVRGLEERRVVRVRHGRGAFVTPSHEWNVFDPDVLAALMGSPKHAEVLADAVECRRIFEIEAAALAAEHADDDDLSALSKSVARMDARQAEEDFASAERDFHRGLVRATHNRALSRLAEPLHAALAAAHGLAAAGPRQRAATIEQHQRILAAVSAGDPDAARAAMREHLDRVAGGLRAVSAAKRPRGAVAAAHR